MKREELTTRVVGAILRHPIAPDAQIARLVGCDIALVRRVRLKSCTPIEVLERDAKRAARAGRKELLEQAVALTMGDRNKDYGDPVKNHQHIADIFNAITGHKITAREVAIFHQATKHARRQTSPLKEDHYVDSMAYVGIEYECAIAEEEGEKE